MCTRERILSLLALVLLPLLTWAQEIQVSAKVDREQADVGSAVTLTLTIVNPPRGTSLDPPALGSLAIVNGPVDANRGHIANGRRGSVFTRTWVLTATKAGTYTIGPATVSVGNASITTDPITLTFVRGQDSPAAGSALEQAQQRNPDLLCVLSLNKSKAFVGEQLIATYTLYSRYGNLSSAQTGTTKANGFWVEEVELGQVNFEPAPRAVNGLQYRVAVIRKQLLIPQRSGKLKIDPVELAYRVNPSFFSQGAVVEIRTNGVELQVNEPPASKPADYIGAVGELQLNSGFKTHTVMVNEPVDLSLRFSGKANLRLIDAPQLDLPVGFETYDPKIVDRITVSASGMNGSREFQYLLIPRHAGEHEIPALTFSYLDPATGAYHTLSTGPLRITAKDDPNAPAGSSAPRQHDVKQLADDIRYIRTGDLGLHVEHAPLVYRWPFWTGLALPVLALIGLLFVHRARQQRLADTSGMRRNNAKRVAERYLKDAATALRNNEREAFHTAVGKALEGFFADRFDLGVAEVDARRIHQHLDGMDSGRTAQAYAELLAESQLARYAPLENKPRQQVYDEAVALIERIGSSPRS